MYVKRVEWVCEWCDTHEEEKREVPVPTEKTRLVKRLLSVTEDYDVVGYELSSEANTVTITIRLPRWDMDEVRAIQSKQQEIGFITVDELIKVQRAGYKTTTRVPPKPQPNDVATLRKRAKQKAFSAGP